MTEKKKVSWTDTTRKMISGGGGELPELRSGCLFGPILSTILGLGLFTILMSLLKDKDSDRGGGNVDIDPDPIYSYDPTDPTEGGRYPNPNDPGRPVVVLPPGEGGGSIYPILPGQVITDPADSMRQVVSDRLNILLEKKNENTGRDFQLAFKTLYPGSEYKFIYFDTLTYRMQMVVPEEKRNELKNSLNAQMPKFDFLLFDEEVFTMSDNSHGTGLVNRRKTWYLNAINAPQAWKVTQGDPDILVAVVDNGFDLNHPELRGKVVDAFNIPERNTHMFPPPGSDSPEHGTHVAATAVGWADENNGVSGVAPKCRLMPVQVATADGMMLSTSVIDGVLYAIYKGAKVVNVSLGPTPPEWFMQLPAAMQQQYIMKDDQRLTQVWKRVYSIADKHHCTVVMAAGNENVLSGYASKARCDTVIVVSAVGETLRKSSFSNYGNFAGWFTNYSTVSAPGENIYNAVPGGKYRAMDGTSMASPIVAGAVALIKSVNPDISTMDIRELLIRSGRKLNEPVGPLIQIDRALQMAKSGVVQPSINK